MTIAITCSCSSRLEVDERFAGQTITCPDCQKTLDVPAAVGVAQRTSGLALTSLVLALVGAFTVIGTVLAVAFGALALWRIQRDPKRLAGTRYALAGIIAGGVLTALSVFAYSTTELFGVDHLLRESQWLGRLDYPDELEIQRKGNGGFKITRPSPQWGVFISLSDATDPHARSGDLLLVNPSKTAYVVCLPELVDADWDFERCQTRAMEMFRRLEIGKTTLRINPNLQVDMVPGNKVLRGKEESGKLTRTMEITLDKTYHGQTRKFLLRVIKKEERDQPLFGKVYMYVLAGGAPAARFDEVKKELRETMDSFQILD